MSGKKSYRLTITPYVNYVTGIVNPSRPTIEEQIIANYNIYSYNYWQGVLKRQYEYRLLQNLRTKKSS